MDKMIDFKMLLDQTLEAQKWLTNARNGATGQARQRREVLDDLAGRVIQMYADALGEADRVKGLIEDAQATALRYQTQADRLYIGLHKAEQEALLTDGATCPSCRAKKRAGVTDWHREACPFKVLAGYRRPA